MKNYYVYVLLDSRDDQVFYVGKGTGERACQHEIEAKGDYTNAKIEKIREIQNSKSNVIIRVIGRYETESEAFAVESTLIHWVYGYDNLTNMQSGHGNDTIREKGNKGEIKGIDIFTDGTYSQKREAEKDNNNIEEYMLEVKEYLESKLSLKLSDFNAKNPKWTSVSFDLDKIKINIGTNNSTRAKTLWVLIEPINGKQEYRNIIKKICTASDFEYKNDGLYARMKNYKMVNSNEELLNTFKDFLKELNQAFESLLRNEIDLKTKKHFENIKHLIIQTQGNLKY